MDTLPVSPGLNPEIIVPSWAPAAWLSEPVWSVLYFIIAFSFMTVFQKAYKKELPWIVALPFILNLIFNFAFSPIQLSLQNNYLASLDIIFVLGTLIWGMWIIYPRIKWVALVNIPYLLWMFFVATLQITITILNR